MSDFDKALVLNFFRTFSRMEFALKVAGFVDSGRYGEAVPAWDRFRLAVEPRWNELLSEEFLAAQRYLFQAPPKRQIVSGGALGWADSVRSDRETDAAFLVRCLKTVRNNLFHGGKSHPYTERDAELLSSGLVVMHELRRLHNGVSQSFEAD